MEERLITIVIILFVLSMIAERVTNFIKLYLPEHSEKVNKLFGVDMFNIKTKSDDPKTETKRARRIFVLAILSGFVVSLSVKANLIEILQAPNQQVLGWDQTYLWNYTFFEALKIIIGCFLTAMFISTGSKFWHDMLDLLLYAKNKRQKLLDESTYSFDRIDYLTKWLEITDGEIALKVQEEHEEELMANPDVISFGVGRKVGGENFLQIVTKSDAKNIPIKLSYKLPDGRNHYVPVEHIVSDEIQTQLKPSDKVANHTMNQFHGTYGVRVCFKSDPDKKTMFLTNYHAVKGSHMKYDHFEYAESDQANVIDPNRNNKIIGQLQFGIRNSSIDAAIVKPFDGNKFENTLPNEVVITTSRNLLKGKRKSSEKVKVYGATTKGTSGTIRVYRTVAKLNYDRGQDNPHLWSLHNLFTITSDNGKSITKGGDSGAAVVDENNQIVGIIVGGSDKISYAIHIHEILDTLNLEIK